MEHETRSAQDAAHELPGRRVTAADAAPCVIRVRSGRPLAAPAEFVPANVRALSRGCASLAWHICGPARYHSHAWRHAQGLVAAALVACLLAPVGALPVKYARGAEAGGPPLPPPPPPLGFDYVHLVQEWPGSFCDTKKGCVVAATRHSLRAPACSSVRRATPPR